MLNKHPGKDTFGPAITDIVSTSTSADGHVQQYQNPQFDPNLDAAYISLLEDSGMFDSTLHECALTASRACADNLNCSRVTVWVSNEKNTALECLSVFNAANSTLEYSTVLSRHECPTFFKALSASRFIDARNAQQDARTAELNDRYLEPIGIRSLLCAPLRSYGNVVGILCLENPDIDREWNAEQHGFAASVADLLSQRIVIDELAASKERYSALYEHSDEGVCVFGGGVFIDVNPACCRIFKAERSELIGKSPIEVSPEFQPDGQPSASSAMQYIQACLAGIPQNFDWVHTRLDGTPFHADITLNAVQLAGEETLFALIRDITDKKEAEEQANAAREKLKYRAAHDSLTGLMNRDQLHTHFNQLIDSRNLQRKDSRIVLLLLDLNRFKEINDTLGHATGDDVLVKLADILNRKVNAIGGDLFRLGGDEFVATFDSAKCTHSMENILQILHNCLKVPIHLNDLSIEMSASIGVAEYPHDGNDSHDLLRCADVAMYHAKNNGTTSAWYDPQKDLNDKRRLAMSVELGAGISQDQLVLHFQPRIQISTGAITGCEALVRWQHPRHGLVQPGEFLPLAEMSELIHPLSEWVLTNVSKQIKRMISNGYAVPVAMNVSTRNLTGSQFVNAVENQIHKQGICPRLFEIEITESTLINHPQKVVTNLQKLAAMGVSIAIDDFGTGYSSLNYLKKLPLSTLKIDQSFVKDMLTDESDSVIVDSTIDLAHNFSLAVVAEGVEDDQTLNALMEKGCDQAQGYLIARPLPADAFDHWLSNYCKQPVPKR